MQSGIETLLYDPVPDAITRAEKYIRRYAPDDAARLRSVADASGLPGAIAAIAEVAAAEAAAAG